MATTELKVKIDAAINAEPTLKALRELKQLQKETVAGSADYKKIQARINDIGDAAKTAKGQSEDWIDALAGAGGPIGMLGRGLDTITSSTNKFGLALKATGIGLIVALVGQLVAAFTQNEKAMKKLEPIMIGFEKILGGIFEALEPVFDIFIDLAMKALPYVTKGIGILYSTLFGLYTFIKDVFVGAGKILVGVFTLDMDTIKEGWNQITSSVSNGVIVGVRLIVAVGELVIEGVGVKVLVGVIVGVLEGVFVGVKFGVLVCVADGVLVGVGKGHISNVPSLSSLTILG